MPWREVSAMSGRQELIALASVEGNRISDLYAVRHQPLHGLQVAGSL
jgi:hypothetical protein